MASRIDAQQRGEIEAGTEVRSPVRDIEPPRRSCSVRAVRQDISERVLAHVITGVEGVYDRHGYLSEKFDALAKLDALVERILRLIGRKTNNPW
jgi:hypothetical protein